MLPGNGHLIRIFFTQAKWKNLDLIPLNNKIKVINYRFDNQTGSNQPGEKYISFKKETIVSELRRVIAKDLIDELRILFLFSFYFMKRIGGIMSNFVFGAVLIIFLPTRSSESIQRSALFDTRENLKVNVGVMIKRQTTRSLISCTQECLSEPRCKIFNYDGKSSQGVCELYEDGNDMQPTQEPGWLCGHLLERKKIVKRKWIKRSFRDAKGKLSSLVVTYFIYVRFKNL